MESEKIFGLALGLIVPWKVSKVELKNASSVQKQELHLFLDYPRPHKFKVAIEGVDQECGVYDHVERSWKHLNFFQHECYLHASVPRVKTSSGKIITVDVPWARPQSGFTLLFEAFCLTLLKCGMSMTKAGEIVGENGKKLCRILRHYIDKALVEQDLEPISKLGIDETSIAKGHVYMTVATDMERKKVVGISKGKDMFAFGAAIGEIEQRNASIADIKAIAMDMSVPFTAAASELLPDAQIVYDRFHLEMVVSKAVDSVRRIEQSLNKDLRNSKYIYLRNESRLTDKQLQRLHYLNESFPSLGEAHRLKEQFKEIWKNPVKQNALEALNEWMRMAAQSEIFPMINAVKTFKAHWSGIISYFDYLLTSGFVERVNLSIQEIKRTAKGYTNFDNFRAMIFLRLGKLELNITHYK